MALESNISSILFVCLGNICRSPLAEGVFRHEAGLQGRKLTIDSAGTGTWHLGNSPDPRSRATALSHDIDISDQRCRQVQTNDFTDFDLIIGMDRSNVADLEQLAPTGSSAQIAMFMQIALDRNEEIPDPYFDGDDGFEVAYQMVRHASRGLLKII